MNTAKTLWTREELTPDEALARLIALERMRASSNQENACIWCGEPANQKRYPEPSGGMRMAVDASLGSDTWYRVCSTSHSTRFAHLEVKLHNDILRPWRCIEDARSLGHSTIAINEWPFNVG